MILCVAAGVATKSASFMAVLAIAILKVSGERHGREVSAQQKLAGKFYGSICYSASAAHRIAAATWRCRFFVHKKRLAARGVDFVHKRAQLAVIGAQSRIFCIGSERNDKRKVQRRVSIVTVALNI